MLILSGILLIIFDQIIKYLVINNLSLGSSLSIIDNFFYVTYIRNTGIAFGLFQNKNIFMIIIISIIIILLLIFYKKEKNKHLTLNISIVLIISGAIGNLIDRIVRGYIVDYINFTFWPAFNLADSFVVIGSILLGFYVIFILENN